MFLLDTSILSATSPVRTDRNPAFERWLIAADRLLYLSVVSVSEVQAGIRKKEREGGHRRAELLRDWWTAIETAYSDRILLLDIAAAREAGNIADAARAHAPGYADIAIAAIARVHGLTVLTANLRHFEPLGVPVANPFVALPSLPPSA